MAEIRIIPESIALVAMDDATYFSEEYKGYISNSKLSLINPDESGSPEKFEEGFTSKYSDSFELGTALHAAILVPEDYEISDITKPNGKLGIFTEAVLKYRQKGDKIIDAFKKASDEVNYYKDKLSTARIKTAIRKSLKFYLKRNKIEENESILYLSETVHKKFTECYENFQNNIAVRKKLNPDGLLISPEVFNENVILCDIEVTLDSGESIILKAKGKLDNFTVDNEEFTIVLNDLKSTGKPVNFFMGNNVKFIEEEKEVWRWLNGSYQKFHYYRQMG